MTEKGFIKWLRKFLSTTDVKDIEFQNRYSHTYNHTTILKRIFDKLKGVKNG